MPHGLAHVSFDNQDFKLHKAEEAWKPAHKNKGPASKSSEDKKTEVRIVFSIVLFISQYLRCF